MLEQRQQTASLALLFLRDGLVVCDEIIGPVECEAVNRYIDELDIAAVGTRNLLDVVWCKELAAAIQRNAAISDLVPPSMVAVQCTLFEKSADKNWLVGLHQDISIPVRERIEHPELNGWSKKDDGWFVQPPVAVLEQLVAVRLHLDECGIEDGPLRVVPGSHTNGKLSNESALVMRDQMGELVCTVPLGGVLIMRPLLLHASSKSSGEGRRRVLHFVFGPSELPFGLVWRTGV